MSLGHVLLGLLVPGERHGYELKRHYDARFPAARPLASAQVYATLARLARDGFVQQQEPERVGGPDRTAYALTAEGRAELQRWLEEVEPPSPFVANPLAVKVTVAVLIAGGDAARDYLHRQRAAHLERMRVYTRTKTAPGAALTEVLAADYALEHLNADLHWIDTALARVAALTEEITP
ncbi:PadR family transcriptional regulator [Kineococcus indalonis]|uniref:PadR family transcriptional regulator n=1 Tax=Kineococcus indalonis TaxID=2696566 RepID=UPI0014125E19|nr:PadR family transcriptional regulator [Kineococcus indalonis]NAZ84540.1 PadR family transcriptional regulator [Kineococcus indalonis]